MRSFKVGDYEVIEGLETGIFKALRHGDEWRDLIGDQLVLALIDRIEELEAEMKAKELLEAMNETNCNRTDSVPDHVKKYYKSKGWSSKGIKPSGVYFSNAK